MHTRYEFQHILHLVLMDAPNFTKLRIKLTLLLLEILRKFETFSSGMCRQHSFIAVET
jgi:hypothetical protein